MDLNTGNARSEISSYNDTLKSAWFGWGKAALIQRAAILCFPLLLLFACKRPETTVATPPPQTTETTEKTRSLDSKIDACSLLTKEELANVQETEITDSKSSEVANGGLLVSQCYFTASDSSKSVSFTVTQNNSQNADKDGVREYWEQTFGRFKNTKEAEESNSKEKAEGREENEKETPPQRVEGLGDEAYWAGNRFGGALYVRKKDVILRLSVGGPGDPPAKLEKSKALAEKALSRL